MRLSVNANHKSQIANHKSQITKKQPPSFSWRRLEVVVKVINRKLSVVYARSNQPSQATQSRLELE